MTFLDALRHFGFPEFIEGELYFHPVAPKCAVCRGDLIGSEIRWSTCGSCGGRSISRRGSASHIPGPGELLEEGSTHTNYNTGEPCFCDARFGFMPGPCLDEEPMVGGTDPTNGTA